MLRHISLRWWNFQVCWEKVKSLSGLDLCDPRIYL